MPLKELANEVIAKSRLLTESKSNRCEIAIWGNEHSKVDFCEKESRLEHQKRNFVIGMHKNSITCDRWNECISLCLKYV